MQNRPPRPVARGIQTGPPPDPKNNSNSVAILEPMKINQTKWTRASGWMPAFDPIPSTAQLVFVFGATATFKDRALLAQIRRAHPGASILGCTTAGEICGTEVTDDSLVVTAATLAHSQVKGVSVTLGDFAGSLEAGEALAQALPPEISRPGGADPLAHVFVLSDGLKVNGSDLVAGMTKHLPGGITVTGGLAGDGARFGETFTLWGEVVAANSIVALGLYGSRLRVGFGSLGGWDAFGPERLVTRSQGNVLYELDGRSALQLYKKYLGEQAAGLPATGLLFPLSLRRAAGETPVVRTILNVDEAQQSMTFAGDIPEGGHVQLMKANFDRLIDGANGAAVTSHHAIGSLSAELAVLISCVGRKLVLKQRIEEEVEGVRNVLGAGAALAGFTPTGKSRRLCRAARVNYTIRR